MCIYSTFEMALFKKVLIFIWKSVKQPLKK